MVRIHHDNLSVVGAQRDDRVVDHQRHMNVVGTNSSRGLCAGDRGIQSLKPLDSTTGDIDRSNRSDRGGDDDLIVLHDGHGQGSKAALTELTAG